jgi:hypothetical protein
VEGSGRGLSQVLSRLLLGATKENHKSQNILPPSPDSNPGYPEQEIQNKSATHLNARFGRPRSTWEDNNYMDLTLTECGFRDGYIKCLQLIATPLRSYGFQDNLFDVVKTKYK